MGDNIGISKGTVQSCAADLNASSAVKGDAEALRLQFNQSMNAYVTNVAAGMSEQDAFTAMPDMVPSSIAQNAVGDRNRQGAVQRMIDCIGERSDFDATATGTLKSMYRESVRWEEQKANPVGSVWSSLKEMAGFE